LKSNTGPCRIFRIEAASGKPAGHFDLPVGACTHSGGLAWMGRGQLFLADTRQVFRIDVERALATGTAEGAMKAVKIAGELRGSYATWDGKDYWIGTWTKEQPKARMFKLDAKLFDDSDGMTVKEDRATESIPVPLEAQGAAFDRDGNLWVSASSGKFGKLYRLDRQGTVKAEYAMVAGLEDLSVDEAGRLWGLSESGTRKYLSWETRYPFIFRIDTAKLK
jgi:sugar lactone lactonase YvrE